MSNDQLNKDEDTIPNQDEKALLLERARLMGISVSNNSSIETLKAKISEKMEGKKSEEPKEENNPLVSKPAKKETLTERVKRENMKLIRLRISNMDPKKKDLPGEIITVANKYLGTVKKYIPYGEFTEEGYHVPYCIYKFLKRRQFLDIRVTKKAGKEVITKRMVKEFNLEVLPPLSENELKKLAAAQTAAGSLD